MNEYVPPHALNGPGWGIRSSASEYLGDSSTDGDGPVTGGQVMAGPHEDTPLRTAGETIETADVAIILVHGRGATAQSIIGLGAELATDGVALLAPQAAGNTWYPNSFLAPVESNEPGRRSGLSRIDSLIDDVAEQGIPADRVVLIGFSQGACLVSEYVARHPRRYGGLGALSGGLIGETIDDNSFSGDLASTPVFLGCSDHDPHIPVERVHKTAEVLDRLNGEVTTRLYPGMGHGINEDEVDHLRRLVQSVQGSVDERNQPQS